MRSMAICSGLFRDDRLLFFRYDGVRERIGKKMETGIVLAGWFDRQNGTGGTVGFTKASV